jgi:hypothetical protein
MNMNKIGVYLIAGLFLLIMITSVFAEQNLEGSGRNSSDRDDDDSEDDEDDDSSSNITDDEDNDIEDFEELEEDDDSLEIEQEIEIEDGENKTKFKVHLSNGRNAEIKIMPETASETALARLRLKVCNETNNCTIQLKEVGKDNETRASYEIQIERHTRILGIFRAKVQNKVHIDAESGNITAVEKPWWTFISAEED